MPVLYNSGGLREDRTEAKQWPVTINDNSFISSVIPSSVENELLKFIHCSGPGIRKNLRRLVS